MTLLLTVWLAAAPPQADRLNAADASARAEAACELGRRRADSAPAVPALLAMLGDDIAVGPVECGMSPWLRRALQEKPDEWRKFETSPAREAARALSRIGQAALQPLLGATADANATVRRHAACALGEMEKSLARGPAADRLSRLLGDSSAEVREAAARALGELDVAAAVGALVARLRDDAPRVRAATAWALGEIDDKSAVKPLLPALADADASVRRQAAWALGELDDSLAVEALAGALEDKDAGVRKQAAWALGEIADQRAAGALSAALKDKSAEVRKQAAWALGELKH